MTGVVTWFTGLPSSGKTTLARRVRAHLLSQKTPTCTLDGDVLRDIIAPKLGYSDADRREFYTALARLAAELAQQGLVVLVPATAHLREYRQHARQLAPRFIEVWLTTPVAECRRRDPKGLYAAATAGSGLLPGVDVLYEEPTQAEVVVSDGEDPSAVERISSLLRRPA
ncbi:MAG TPA: adenylyl-sulfate kinase [Polyangiaceae bacterium]|nr:adenylyl-sulfate kinase [Polyangiaceae bacterium]